ncbi:MFS transporter [Brucella pseudogrignonensis]|uniref:MFS transporter n=1 Tax=Brucella pseudogrignonensis TaxID=419475 RepID=UPI003ED026B3
MQFFGRRSVAVGDDGCPRAKKEGGSVLKSSTKWHVLIGGFIVYLFDAMEISILGISLPALRQELDLSISQGGLLATASWIGIGVSGIAMGWMADNYGRRRALLASLIVFGTTTAAFAWASASYTLMVALRFTAGLGLGGVWAILAAYVAETWPAQYRGRVTLLVLSAYPAGAALAAWLGGMLLPDWRAIFLWCGVSVIFPLLYVILLIPESAAWQADVASRKNSSASNAEADANEAVRFTEIFHPTLLRQTIFGSATAMFALFAYIALLTWLPSYLTVERGLTIAQASHYVLLFNGGVFASYFVFGFVADWIGKKLALIVSLIGVAIMLAIYTQITDLNTLLWFGPLVGLFIVFSGLLGSFFSEIYPIRVRTTGSGFCFNIGRAIASFSPILLGGVAHQFNFATALSACAGIFVLAAFTMIWLPGGERRKSGASVNITAVDRRI